MNFFHQKLKVFLILPLQIGHDTFYELPRKEGQSLVRWTLLKKNCLIVFLFENFSFWGHLKFIANIMILAGFAFYIKDKKIILPKQTAKII